MIKKIVLFSSLLLFVSSVNAVVSSTLSDTKNTGYLKCGVNGTLPGFSYQSGRLMYGMDADFCRAVAAAIFGSDVENKVNYKRLTAKERFVALQSGEIDLLARNTTWNASRDNSLGLEFVGVSFYDGQGFIVKKDLGIDSVEDLDNAVICVITGTTHEQNIADFFKKNSINYRPYPFEDENTARRAYEFDRCDAYSRDRSALAADLTKMSDDTEHKILDQVISKEPLGPVVRESDSGWINIVRWVLFALIEAEELGITRENVDEIYQYATDPTLLRFFGKQGEIGAHIGLSPDWAVNVIKAVGNYGEMYEANVWSSLKLPRGINSLWKNGGLLYSPPFK